MFESQKNFGEALAIIVQQNTYTDFKHTHQFYILRSILHVQTKLRKNPAVCGRPNDKTLYKSSRPALREQHQSHSCPLNGPAISLRLQLVDGIG